jgi:hypothetical protein
MKFGEGCTRQRAQELTMRMLILGGAIDIGREGSLPGSSTYAVASSVRVDCVLIVKRLDYDC